MSPYFKVLHPNHGESRVLCPDHPPPTTHPPLSTRLQCLLSGDPTSIPDHPPPILHSPLRPALGLSVRSLGPGIPKPEDRRTLLSPQPATTSRDPCVAPCVVNQCSVCQDFIAVATSVAVGGKVIEEEKYICNLPVVQLIYNCGCQEIQKELVYLLPNRMKNNLKQKSLYKLLVRSVIVRVSVSRLLVNRNNRTFDCRYNLDALQPICFLRSCIASLLRCMPRAVQITELNLRM